MAGLNDHHGISFKLGWLMPSSTVTHEVLVNVKKCWTKRNHEPQETGFGFEA
jgi:hypothetical protein